MFVVFVFEFHKIATILKVRADTEWSKHEMSLILSDCSMTCLYKNSYILRKYDLACLQRFCVDNSYSIQNISERKMSLTRFLAQRATYTEFEFYCMIDPPSYFPHSRQLFIISRTKSQSWNVCRFILKLSLTNPLKLGVKSRMKM